MAGMFTEIRKVFAGMIKDLIGEDVPKDKYIDAQNINLTQNTDATKGGATVSLGNEFKIRKKEINFATDADDYAGYRIALDLSAPNITHTITYTPPGSSFSISSSAGTPHARYDDLVSQIGIDATFSVYLESGVFTGTVYIGIKSIGFQYTVTETIATVDSPVYLIKEFYGTACNGVFQPLKTLNIGNDLYIISSNGTVINESVAVKNETTQDWTYTTVLQTKQIQVATNAVIDLDGQIDFGTRVSLYFTGQGYLPRAFYVTHEDVWQPYFSMIYNENPDYLQSGNPDGQYTYENIEANTRLQVIKNLATVQLSTVNNSGGALTTGDKMYLVRQRVAINSYTGFSLVSNPVSIFSDPTTDTNLSGNIGGASTSKSVTLTINNLDNNDYDKVQLVVVNNVDGAITAEIVGDYPITGDSITVTHTGLEATSSITVAELITAQVVIKDSANLVINRNRLFLSNISTYTDPDISDWAKTIVVATRRTALPAIGDLYSTVNEYMKPDNIFNYVGYMLNETYRVGITVLFKSGIIATYFVKDHTITWSNGALTSDFTPADIYVYYLQCGVNFDSGSDPEIDGVTLGNAIFGYSIVRQECIPEVLGSGVIMPSTFVDSGIYCVGKRAVAGVSSVVNRRLGSFLCADLLFDQTSISPQNGDIIINYGITQEYGGDSETRVDGLLTDVCTIVEMNGIVTTSESIPIITGEVVQFNSTGLIQLDGTNKYETKVVTFTANSGTFSQKSIGVYVSADINVIKGGFVIDNAIYQAQYFRSLTNKYGTESQGVYKSCGNFRSVSYDSSGVFGYIESVYGGDVFTEKNFVKFCNGKETMGPPDIYRRQGISFYSQNRGNYQLRYFSPSEEFLNYPYTTTSLVQWLSGATTNAALNYSGTLSYSKSYTPLNNFQTFQGFDPALPQITNQENIMFYSDLKDEGQLGDPYRVFRPLNQKAYPLIYGAITNTFRSGNNIIILQYSAVSSQEINQQAVIQSADSLALVLGDGSVLGARETPLTQIGGPTKTAALQYLSPKGGIYIAWYNKIYNKMFRLGPDGIRDLGTEDQMQSFLTNNNRYIGDNWSMVMGYNYQNSELLMSANYNLPEATPFNMDDTYAQGTIVYVAGWFTTRKYYIANINVPAGVDPGLPSSQTQYWKIYRESNYTLAFNEEINAFSSFYSYTPVIFMPYKKTFLTFSAAGGLDTNIYEHNKNTGLFYDDPVIAYITFVYNDQNQVWKRARNVFVQITNIPTWINFKGLNGSLTYSEQSDMAMKRDYWWSYVKNDATITAANPNGLNNQFTARVGGETVQATLYFEGETTLKELIMTLEPRPRLFNT